MEKNKTGKYLKYAIGEIVLVVIGILIALQINNWNENKKRKSQQSLFLIDMEKELESDVAYLNQFIENFNRNYSIRKTVFETKNKTNISLDSLLILYISPNLDLILNSQWYDKATNLGITKFSENDTLNRLIDNYYKKRVNRFARFTSYVHEYNKKETDYYIQNAPFDVIELITEKDIIRFTEKVNLNIQRTDKDLQQQLVNFFEFNTTKNFVYNGIYLSKASKARLLFYRDSVLLPLKSKIHIELSKN